MQSGDLLLIANCLDCFYEIWSEENYNQLLKDFNILALMKQGYPTLLQLRKEANKRKLYSAQELDEIDEAVSNLESFVTYKMNLV